MTRASGSSPHVWSPAAEQPPQLYMARAGNATGGILIGRPPSRLLGRPRARPDPYRDVYRTTTRRVLLRSSSLEKRT
jgi:hypothetical protein